MVKHAWVALSYTPIEIDVLEDGTLHTFTSEHGDDLAREGAALVCFLCGETLTAENHDTDCIRDEVLKNISTDV